MIGHYAREERVHRLLETEHAHYHVPKRVGENRPPPVKPLN